MRALRLGIAGLGTVGTGVFHLLSSYKDMLRARAGVDFDVVAVSARDRMKDRGLDLTNVLWVDNPCDLAAHPDVDVVVELMGGEGDPAYTLVRTALEQRKSVVTANKALLAHHGGELAELAERNGVCLAYEATVAGGIPIIKMLREGLAANRLDRLCGVLNGTCNYILTTMEETGRSFSEVLVEAQRLGYAEADPALDVGGGDTGHKLCLLGALAFGSAPDFEHLDVHGITSVIAADMMAADEFGYRIKLIGFAQHTSAGGLLRFVSPCLIPKLSPLAHVGGVLNGVVMDGTPAGQTFVSGRGAGSGPTASAVVADLIDVGRQIGSPAGHVFGVTAKQLSAPAGGGLDQWSGSFYLRLVVQDQPGVIAEIAPILRDEHISIESLIQHGRSENEPVNIVIMTHHVVGQQIRVAMERIGRLRCVMAPPFAMPVLEL